MEMQSILTWDDLAYEWKEFDHCAQDVAKGDNLTAWWHMKTEPTGDSMVILSTWGEAPWEPQNFHGFYNCFAIKES